MSLLSLNELSIRYRGPMLLDEVSARIETGDRIGLLGRNGAGKSTLLKMIDGEVTPDHGTVQLAPRARVARLIQDVPKDVSGSVMDVVQRRLAEDAEPDQQWQAQLAAGKTLSQMELDGDAKFESLSSGMKRRVLLAQAIAMSPDLLLLDEPTNHLDIPSILWLETFLQKWRGTLMFITHDRSFLQNLATRIWEIDRGRLFDWTCDYATFLDRKQAALEAEEKQNALFDKKLAQEEVWIRQGIKARRTRNEGRVRALKKMREQRADRPKATGKARLNLNTDTRSGALVAELKEVCFAYDDHPIMNDFSTTIMRGDRVGIIGPNGAGKSTLLKLILGQLEPQSGSVRLGTNLSVAYFDQLRDTLDPEQTVAENVGEGGDRIEVGDTVKHIYGYLQDFLFSPERSRTPVKFLSGGERNRVLLAKLMTKPANVIVLDEPTNDLDAETLELLEEQLIGFGGTILMVSHDRAFLNSVVTSTIVFEPNGVSEYVGGYDDYRAAVQRREERSGTRVTPAAKPNAASKPSAVVTKTETKKLSYKDQRELDQLPQRIDTIESDIAALHTKMADPQYYQSDPKVLADDGKLLQTLEADLSAAYERFEALS